MTILSTLKTEMPSLAISTESQDLKEYGRDWTRVYEPNPLAICFPKSTQEVSELLKFCSKHAIPIVPSGGRTGLAGGAVAQAGELVLSLEKMRAMGDVDPLAMTLKCEAGAITQAVHQKALEKGLFWPIDFASKGSSTVGGNLATNAGGVKVIRYGLTRNWVLGLTIVLMSGEILNLNGSLEKNNTGIDLRQLFIGSEGILGVITEAILKLASKPREADVFFLGLENLSKVFELFQVLRTEPITINAYECLSRECLEVVLKHRSMANPFSEAYPYLVLLELEKPWPEALFESAALQNAVQNIALAQSPKDAQKFWEMREGISEALAARGLLHKHDISLPISQLENFIQQWSADLAQSYPQLKPYVFGHIGDGNLHVNLMKPSEMSVEDFRALCRQADENLFSWLQKFEGSVSAEHGIGLLKKHMLSYTRSESEIRLMKAMKKVFDPKNLLNPGKIF